MALYLGPHMRKNVDMLRGLGIVMPIPPDGGRIFCGAATWSWPGKERVNGDKEGGIRRLRHQFQGMHRNDGGRLRQQAGEPERYDQEALGVREEAQTGQEVSRRPLRTHAAFADGCPARSGRSEGGRIADNHCGPAIQQGRSGSRAVTSRRTSLRMPSFRCLRQHLIPSDCRLHSSDRLHGSGRSTSWRAPPARP